MLNRGLYYIILAFLANIFVSCEKEIDSSMLWGKTDYYKDFLFYDYEPVRMTKTICFEANEDANGRVKNVKFGLFKKDENGSYIPVNKDVILYKNGELCSNNEFLVGIQDKEVELGIEFTPDAKAGVHKWFLKVLENGGYDRINEYSTMEEALPLLLEWKAEKNDIVNPLKLGLNTFLLTIGLILLVWLLILKPQAYPNIKLKKLYVLYEGRQVPVKLSGVHKVVCTSRTMSQGFLSRLFTGKIVYVKDSFWSPGDVVIMSKDRNSVKIKFSAQYIMMPNIVTNKQPVEIRHKEKKENVVTFRVQ